MVDPSASLIVALVAVGMAAAFLAADPRSPTSRALALCLGLLGATIVVHVAGRRGMMPASPLLWPRLASLAEAGALAAGFEWIARVGRTKGSDGGAGETLLTVAQALAAAFGLLGLVAPALRAEVVDVEFTRHLLARPAYYLFAVPVYASLGLSTVRIAELVRSPLEESERVRLVALAMATPFLVSGLVVPAVWGPFTTAIGELIFLGGAVRYHVLQGRRGQFLARFLSPEVARQVHERGLSSTMQQSRVQLSVVACDLRGFTAFAESAAPEDVIQVLREYYAAIGAIVTRFGGTIKDFAGDGILVLVGAPIAAPDHARRAVSMAIDIRQRGGELVARWRRLGLDLGLGVGVASGFVTVGTIDGSGRLEYAAIGPAVNLASRLCDRAESGQVLVDQRTVGLAGEDGAAPYRFEPLVPLELKGFARPIAVAAALPREAPTESPLTTATPSG